MESLLIASVLMSTIADASSGDRAPLYWRCIGDCVDLCQRRPDVLQTYFPRADQWPRPNVDITTTLWWRRRRRPSDDGLVFRWSCHDECLYLCQWPIVELFRRNGFGTPQFFGKVNLFSMVPHSGARCKKKYFFSGQWPFARFAGMQEPASAAASILNLLVNLYALRRFSREVPVEAPMRTIWIAQACVSV